MHRCPPDGRSASVPAVRCGARASARRGPRRARDRRTRGGDPSPRRLTPISFSASVSRAISARAAASSGSGPDPGRTPGLDAANASNAPWRATWRNFITVERSTPARSAAAAIVYSPRARLNQISYFSDGERKRLLRRLRGPAPLNFESVMIGRSWTSPTGSQMRTDWNGEVWREVRRKPSPSLWRRKSRCRWLGDFASVIVSDRWATRTAAKPVGRDHPRRAALGDLKPRRVGGGRAPQRSRVAAGAPAGLIDMHRALTEDPVAQVAVGARERGAGALTDGVHGAGRDVCPNSSPASSLAPRREIRCRAVNVTSAASNLIPNGELASPAGSSPVVLAAHCGQRNRCVRCSTSSTLIGGSSAT